MKVMKVIAKVQVPTKPPTKASQAQGKPPTTWDTLAYKKDCRGPRHYGSVTIYTSSIDKQWRIKPAPGRRDEKKIHFNIDGILAIEKHKTTYGIENQQTQRTNRH